MRLPLPLTLLVALAASAWWAPTHAERAAAQPAKSDLQGTVKQLVTQLGAADATQQTAAEWALLKLGPDILPLLPTPDPKDASPPAQRLRAVAATLRELLPRTVTLKGGMTLGATLQELTRQAGVPVIDRRVRKDDRIIKQGFKETPFWRALDAIAASADARTYLYGEKGAVTLASSVYWPASGPPPLFVSYHGPFRTTVQQVFLTQDLDFGGSSCVVWLQVAWEPRFQPFLIEPAGAAALFAKDASGKALEAKVPARGPRSVMGGPAADFDLHLPAPARSCARIDSLKGSAVLTLPSRMLTFTFERLRFIGPKDRKEVKGQDGITVTLNEVRQETDPPRWVVEVVIDNPPAGPHFDTNHSWLDHNAIWLEKGAGNARQRLQPKRDDEEVLQRTSTQARVRYHFVGGPGQQLGKLSDWTLMYRTPGRMVEVTVPYAFKDVPLP